MQGLILAGGRGSRLGRYAPDTPKCLLEVGRRRLIEHQLEACAEAGIAPVGIVLGYCADEIREVVGIRAEYLFNPRWAATNSMYSFYQARDWVKGPLVVMNCDLLFEPAILAKLIEGGQDALVYDSSSGSGLEHMKVKAADGRLLDLSKSLPPDEVAGENVGMLYFTAETARAVMAKAGELIAAGNETAWLASAVRLVAQERPIAALDVAGLAWGEIDTAYDLDHVRKKIWPVIERARRGRKRRTSRWALSAVVPALAVAAAMLWTTPLRPEPAEATSTWETVSLSGAQPMDLVLGARKQKWLVVPAQGVVEAEVDGPGRVRIDSRLDLGQRKLADPVPYVIKLELDGVPLDMVRKEGKRDKAVEGNRIVTKQRRVTLDIPHGHHRLTIGVVTPKDDIQGLVRVRTLEADLVAEGPDAEADP